MQVFQVNISDGGVPKRACNTASITAAGVERDRQRDLEVHGGPERAVCLYSLERILSLQAEGHPIYPGAIGENLTLSGVDWEQIVPGTRLRIGEQVLLEVTRYTIPCNNIAPAFKEGYYGRVSPNQHPGWARVYARVLQPGRVQTSDPVEIVAAAD
jgi:MOSC domain-containing protein YiiM